MTTRNALPPIAAAPTSSAPDSASTPAPAPAAAPSPAAIPEATSLRRLVGRHLPLTAAGWWLLGLGVVAYLGGWRLGWTELMVLAAAAGVALVFAVPFVLRREALTIHRKLAPATVTVGEPAHLRITVTNRARSAVAAAGTIATEHIAGKPVALSLGGLRPSATRETRLDLPTNRRGVVELGPLTVVKADPLGLLRRDVHQAKVERLEVQPRTQVVAPVPTGLAKDLEGPTSGDSPAGDISFHALRDYQFGDDPRHVHWLSTARTGDLMVRHHVDNRLPHVGLVLDTRRSSYRFDEPAPDARSHAEADSPGFETAIEIAGSVLLGSLRSALPVTWAAGQGPARATSPTKIASALTVLDTADESPLPEHAVAELVRLAPDVSVVVLITGSVPAERLMATAQQVQRFGATPLVVRSMAGDAPLPPVPSTITIDVSSLEEFAISWNQRMRS